MTSCRASGKAWGLGPPTVASWPPATGLGADSPGTPGIGPVTIELMRRRDLRAVLRIDAQQPQHGWSVGLYLAELRRARPSLPRPLGPGGGERAVGDRCYVVARAEGRVVGFAGLLVQLPDAHVTTIAVDSEVRGSRLGTRLMLVVADRARAAGADNLTLEVRAGNAPAIALYRRFGLVPVGMRKGYYADIGEDALVMWGNDLRTDAYAARLAGIEARLQEPTIIEGLDP